MTTPSVSLDPPSVGKTLRLPDAASAAWPLAAILMLLAMQLSMVFTRAINWDEFWFYYHVADFGRGNLAQPLQSLHVRLFAWLPAIGVSSVDKIVVARLVMLACEVGTLAAIYAIARRFASHGPSLLVVLLYLSGGFVMQHGFSFRTDPMATASLMGALAILARCRLTFVPLAAFALLIGIAGMITMKAVLYAPAFLGLAWMRWSEDRLALSTALRLAAAGIAAIVTFLLLYVWHSGALTQDTQGTSMAAAASRWMFFLGIPPYWQMGLKAAFTAPVLTLLALAAPFIIWRSALTRDAKLALTGLWLPVTLPLFYTNSAAYFYVFMLAPVAASTVVAAEKAVARYSTLLITAALSAMATWIFVIEDRATIERQRLLVETAETLLPPGTAYFDHNGMLASMDKANWLMTPATIEGHKAAGTTMHRTAMEQRAVPMLLVNDEIYEAVLAGEDGILPAADTQALRDNYLPFWGPVWLAGKAVPAGASITTEVLVPGTYSVVGGPLIVDGSMRSANGSVTLARGSYTISAPDTSARLVWGEKLAEPSARWNDGPLYVDF